MPPALWQGCRCICTRLCSWGEGPCPVRLRPCKCSGSRESFGRVGVTGPRSAERRVPRSHTGTRHLRVPPLVNASDLSLEYRDVRLPWASACSTVTCCLFSKITAQRLTESVVYRQQDGATGRGGMGGRTGVRVKHRPWWGGGRVWTLVRERTWACRCQNVLRLKFMPRY